MKRIDMQFPRLVYGGAEPVVFTQYESEAEQIPTEQSTDLFHEHLETYYRAILLCEYYADFFARQVNDGHDYILFMKPMNDNAIGNLLTFFFDLRRQSSTFQYT